MLFLYLSRFVVRINIVSGKDYVIGRKGCDIVIDGDKSISRKHGTLRMTHHEENLVCCLIIFYYKNKSLKNFPSYDLHHQLIH